MFRLVNLGLKYKKSYYSKLQWLEKHFVRFPRSEVLANEWKKAIEKNIFVTKCNKECVCIEHFRESDFTGRKSRWELKIPNLTQRFHSQLWAYYCPFNQSYCNGRPRQHLTHLVTLSGQWIYVWSDVEELLHLKNLLQQFAYIFQYNIHLYRD